MLMSVSEAVNSESNSTDGNNSDQAMPAIMSSNSGSNSLLNRKRTASSSSTASAQERCSISSLGAGPLWWS